MFFFFKQKTAYEIRISDWSSYVCSSVLGAADGAAVRGRRCGPAGAQAVRPRPGGRRGLTAGRSGRRTGGSAGRIDRQRVVSGKRVSVRVDLGGRRNTKKKNNTENQTRQIKNKCYYKPVHKSKYTH